MECVVLRGSVDGSGGSGGSGGYGSGDSYGSGGSGGYGYGDSYGSGGSGGYGYGDSYGSGDGDGDGAGDYWRLALPSLMGGWTPDQLARATTLMSAGVPLAYWRSTDDGLPANGGRLDKAVAPGQFQRVAGPLLLCLPGTLHATLIPPKWQGSRVWIVALHGEVIGTDEKLGCLEREILGECCLGNVKATR